MAAKLIISPDTVRRSEHPIEDPVIRIGSGPQCELRLDEPRLPAHAATLEYRDGGYVLHNRSDDPVDVAGRPLGLRDSTPWHAGEEAGFGDVLTIVLDVEGDPAPARAPGPAVRIEFDPEDADEEETPSGSSGAARTLQLALILASVPLCAWMLTLDAAPAGGGPGRDGVPFPRLLDRLDKNKADLARGAHSDRATLQRARAAEYRGDRAGARALYGALRDRLLLRRSGPGPFPDPDEKAVWDHVAARLQALSTAESP